MDFADDEHLESGGWSSSGSEDIDQPDSVVLAVTPYSRITTQQLAIPIARKSLLPGHRPPHDPKRELAILKFLTEKLPTPPPPSQNVIPLLSYDVLPSGRITLDFPLMQTDLKQIYLERKEAIVKDPAESFLLLQRFMDILSAIEWIHAQGVIHRDVNPSNILLSNDLHKPSFLADFGISWIEGYPDDPAEGISKYSAGVGTGYPLEQH
jgi:serine/threonine protein kinase